jgi:hypothetical protein
VKNEMMALLAKAVIGFLSFVGNSLIGKLPTSPFAAIGSNPAGETWARTIGYFFPVSEIVSHTEALLLAIGVWMALRWVFRIVRAIG